jgi:hypothetical protein
VLDVNRLRERIEKTRPDHTCRAFAKKQWIEMIVRWQDQDATPIRELQDAQREGDLLKQATGYESIAEKYSHYLPGLSFFASAAACYRDLGDTANAERVLRKGVSLVADRIDDSSDDDCTLSLALVAGVKLLVRQAKICRSGFQESDLDRLTKWNDRLKKVCNQIWIDNNTPLTVARIYHDFEKQKEAEDLTTEAIIAYRKALDICTKNEKGQRLTRCLKDSEELLRQLTGEQE